MTARRSCDVCGETPDVLGASLGIRFARCPEHPLRVGDPDFPEPNPTVETEVEGLLVFDQYGQHVETLDPDDGCSCNPPCGGCSRCLVQQAGDGYTTYLRLTPCAACGLTHRGRGLTDVQRFQECLANRPRCAMPDCDNPACVQALQEGGLPMCLDDFFGGARKRMHVMAR